MDLAPTIGVMLVADVAGDEYDCNGLDMRSGTALRERDDMMFVISPECDGIKAGNPPGDKLRYAANFIGSYAVGHQHRQAQIFNLGRNYLALNWIENVGGLQVARRKNSMAEGVEEDGTEL